MTGRRWVQSWTVLNTWCLTTTYHGWSAWQFTKPLHSCDRWTQTSTLNTRSHCLTLQQVKVVPARCCTVACPVIFLHHVNIQACSFGSWKLQNGLWCMDKGLWRKCMHALAQAVKWVRSIGIQSSGMCLYQPTWCYACIYMKIKFILQTKEMGVHTCTSK